MTDDPHEVTDRSTSEPRSSGWPVSSYPILLAIVFLSGTALVLVVSTNETANRLATFAYSSLVLGVLIRVLEHLGTTRLPSALGRSDTVGGSVRAAVLGAARSWLPVVSLRRLTYRGSLTTTGRWQVFFRRLRSVLTFTIPLIVFGGLLIVILVWIDLGLVVTWTYLVWWLTSIGLLVTAYVAVSLVVR